MVTLTTERLDAKPATLEDADDFARMHRNPQVMGKLGGTLGGLKSSAETKRMLDEIAWHWKKYGCGVFSFRDRETGKFVGRAGLRNVEIDGVREVEVMVALMPAYWSKGYATEITKALLKYSAEEMKLPTLVAFVLPDNAAGRKVLEKTGLRYEKDVVYSDQPQVLYRIGKKPAPTSPDGTP